MTVQGRLVVILSILAGVAIIPAQAASLAEAYLGEDSSCIIFAFIACDASSTHIIDSSSYRLSKRTNNGQKETKESRTGEYEKKSTLYKLWKWAASE